jgi:hypothetical protein
LGPKLGSSGGFISAAVRTKAAPEELESRQTWVVALAYTGGIQQTNIATIGLASACYAKNRKARLIESIHLIWRLGHFVIFLSAAVPTGFCREKKKCAHAYFVEFCGELVSKIAHIVQFAYNSPCLGL